MSDLVDVVDTRDRYTGSVVSVDEAHIKRLPHRVVAVFIFDRSGRLYVQVHKNSGGKLDHTVGGHVDLGETYDDAAYRETEEEVGIVDHTLDRLFTGLYSDEGSCIHVFAIYESIEPQKWEFKPNEEVGEIVPMYISEIVGLMNKYGTKKFTAGFMSTMKKYIDLKSIKDVTLNWEVI